MSLKTRLKLLVVSIDNSGHSINNTINYNVDPSNKNSTEFYKPTLLIVFYKDILMY